MTPKLQAAGWDNDPYSIAEQRSITDGRVIPVGKGFIRKPPKRVDYLLRYTRDLPLAVVEAKASYKSAHDAVQQARAYAETLGLKFAFATNGAEIIEIDYFKGTETPVTAFPDPTALWARYQAGAGIQGEARSKCIAASISAKSTLLEVARQFDDEAMIRFVDNLTAKPAKRKDAQNGGLKVKTVSGSTRAAEKRFTEVEQPIADENVFFYESNLVGSFQVEIRFGDEFQKKDILKALKETFEHVKTSK